MSESDEINIAAPLRGGKLTLDSEQQEKKEAEERQIQQEIRLRKQQKRKKREEAEKLALQKAKLEQEKEKKYLDPENMFEEDSNSHTSYGRVQKKIKKQYPQFKRRDQRKSDFIDDSQDQSEQQQSESSSETNKKVQKKKKIQKPVQKKVQKKKPKYEPQQLQQRKVKKEKVKIQPKNDKKQNLVRQLSVRWWYALPQWPPKDYDYQGKLKKQGYRVLDPEKFRLEDDVVNGLQKVIPVDGYLGVYKSKTKLIDIRPKQSAPTLNRFRSMSIEQLSNLVKTALKQQISQLKNVKYSQQGQEQLIKQLQKQLNKMTK